MKKRSIFVCILIAALCLFACTAPAKTDSTGATGEKRYSIRYDLGSAADDFIQTPTSAKAGETVEIKTEVLIDADLHLYVDGQEIDKTHYDSDYWGYSFVMPQKSVQVTAQFYTKSEIWG